MRAAVGLGSNVGDRLDELRHGRAGLERLGTIACLSSVWETEPRDLLDQPPFLNAVVLLETSSSPQQLLEGCLAIEKERGRLRTVPRGPRTLDLDLLLAGDRVVQDARLTLPHPRLAERRFVLAPLCEVAPDWRHPLLGATASELLARCSDAGRVARTGLELAAPSPRLRER